MRVKRTVCYCVSYSAGRLVECVWNLMAHGDTRQEKWRGNWRMEWVASTLTLSRKVVYTALRTLMGTPRLPVADWNDAPAHLNGLARFGERRNLVSARVPSRFKRSLRTTWAENPSNLTVILSRSVTIVRLLISCSLTTNQNEPKNVVSVTRKIYKQINCTVRVPWITKSKEITEQK
jgi:hypothetical protein